MLPFARSRLAICATVCLLWVTVTGSAHGEVDVLMRAVGFALTGSDDAEPKAIDRENCVFALKNDIFHLNNIETDRITLQPYKYGISDYVIVSLHGDEVIYETTTQPMHDDGSELMQLLKEKNPELFQSRHLTYNEHSITLSTADEARVSRAWQYIYSHGCIGKKSPF
jgi:hypothetical protein